jgi:hypothetical protein
MGENSHQGLPFMSSLNLLVTNCMFFRPPDDALTLEPLTGVHEPPHRQQAPPRFLNHQPPDGDQRTKKGLI